MLDFTDGRAPFGEYQTYYKIFGDDAPTAGPPLLVLHGGPGSAHNYMLDVSRVAEAGRQVVFYDQVGCGLSTGPDEAGEYNFDLFIDELNNLRDHLGLEDIHVLGHSWGGMLAIEYLLREPKGVNSAVLASAMISMPLFKQELEGLRKALPKETLATLKTHEHAGTTVDPEYEAAYRVYHAKHIFRGDQKPPYAQAPENPKNDMIYHALWGVNEAYPNGSLSHWDRIGDLGKISVPTLVIAGKHDELTPKQAELTAKSIPYAERVEMEHSAHVPHMEEPSRYIEEVSEFLARVESSK